jgi:pimeloyl-ACP methyl ester carboxylesterase
MILAYDEAGSGQAIVLIHAGVADRTMWSELLEPLAAAGYRAIAVDLPGFGEAVPPGPQIAPWTDVLETLDALAIEAAVLVGNSFGAGIALRAAAAAPDRVTALVLVSVAAPGLDPSPELEMAATAEEQALERGDTDEAIEAVVAAWTLPDAPLALRERIGAMQRRAFELQAQSGELALAPDPLEDPSALAQIDLPVLCVVGEHDMRFFHDSAAVLEVALPRARPELIEGAGHLAPLEQPERFREVLLGFLRSG